MAKAAPAPASDKPSKLAKKRSQQDLKADAPPKPKKAKQIEQEPASTPVEPSPSKSKKEKKGKDAAKEVKEFVAEAEGPTKAGKKEKKRRESVSAPDETKVEGMTAEVSEKKKKRTKKAVAEIKSDVSPETKKRRGSAAVPPEQEVTEESKVEEAGEKKKKRKATVVEEKTADSGGKTKNKRKDTGAEVKTATNASSITKDVPTSETKSKKASKASVTTEESPAQPTVKETSKSKVKAKPAPEPEIEQEKAEEELEEQDFYGFSSDDDDSSDEDEMADDIPGIDLGRLPTIAKDDATVKRKLERAKRKPTEDRGVIYIGRIPHGFYEDQMRHYFSQFGTVTRLRVSRNKKTGKPKHYGFVEFDSSSVAQIVAETMDNYLLMGHILTCKLIPKDKVHPELWVGANRKWRSVPRDRVARVAHNKARTEDGVEKAEARLLKRQERRKRKLEEAGIKYDFEAVAYKKKAKPTEA